MNKLHANVQYNSLDVVNFITGLISACSNKAKGPWILFETANGNQGYVNSAGDTTIQPGTYSICFTDTFNTFAIVHHDINGLVAIDRNENILFNVFPYDNGPDYISDGLFRIVNNNKIGYADAMGNIVIEPSFGCAYPFENGKAMVAVECQTESIGEHSSWVSENWFYIDKKGKRIE